MPPNDGGASGAGPRFAAALRYDREKHRAPLMVAKGAGDIAERIIALAREHGIPIKDDPALVQVLMKLDLNREIPPELYQAVAEILALIYRADESFRGSRASSPF
ncbi:MAG: EscU/YscU/HrcU family type III secretion system export apparatus switch protein [Deltaproteobacteria bacterium]|nr:EscU/YscU/HrcU family type III secretion system export apparatus switch protein [Candidatus Anaeroferrophillacea bacterium]